MSSALIDRMRAPDWEQVSSIYLEGIRSGHSTFETNIPSWEQWDAAHLQVARLVLRDGDVVLGWAALSPVSKRHAYRGVAETTVYVTESRRGEGLGRALLEALIAESEKNEIWTLQASIFPETPPALNSTCAVASAKSVAASESPNYTTNGATPSCSNVVVA